MRMNRRVRAGLCLPAAEPRGRGRGRGLRAGRGAGCRGLWLACLLALGAPALAGRLGGGPQLGDAAPWPEAVADLSRDVRVFVRILDDASGALAAEVAAPRRLRIEAGLIAGEDMAETALALTCRVVRYDPAGQPSPPLAEGRCFDGVLSGAAPGWAALQFDASFLPGPDDRNGTAGGVVTVQEGAGKRGVNVLATYRWTGGAE